MKEHCVCCGQVFNAWRKDQHYCMRADCRKERKKAFQKAKLSKDVDYRRNQADAQRRWREKHKDYWRRYRESHPWYVERNRRLQHTRNARRCKRSFLQNEGSMIAKMDAQPIEITGTYRLIRVIGRVIAKMDDIVVRITPVTST
jgi:hypothetical protein